jgi:glycosyltransferase involved in cell wall biosynthesis
MRLGARDMKLSILTTSYNSEATIGYTIESFLAQSHADKEMLILDGASQDRTVDIARSFKSADIRVFSERDLGMYDALNKGLQLFSGDACGVLNSDDTFHDRLALSRTAEALTEYDMVHASLDFVRDHKSKQVVRQWRAEPKPRSGFRSGWMPAHPTFYARRKVVENVGRFDLTYSTSSDYDWMLRAIELHDFSLGIVAHTTIDMMMGGRSTSGIASLVKHNFEALQSRRARLKTGLVDYAIVAKPMRKFGQLFQTSHQ